MFVFALVFAAGAVFGTAIEEGNDFIDVHPEAQEEKVAG